MRIANQEAQMTKGYLRLPRAKVIRLIKTSVGEIFYFARDVYKVLHRPEDKYLIEILKVPDEDKMTVHPWVAREPTWVNVVNWEGLARLAMICTDNDQVTKDDLLMTIEDAAADPSNILWEQVLWDEA